MNDLVLTGKNVIARLVEESDASFILDLRNNEELGRYLSKTDTSLDNQIEWIKKYKEREIRKEEFYFKVSDKLGDLGFFRLYNIDYDKKELTFGSFIMKVDRPKYAAIESMILAVNYAFDKLNMDKVLLDVRVKNERAKHFYNRFGYVKIDENELDEFYELTKERYDTFYRNKYMEMMKNE